MLSWQRTRYLRKFGKETKYITSYLAAWQTFLEIIRRAWSLEQSISHEPLVFTAHCAYRIAQVDSELKTVKSHDLHIESSCFLSGKLYHWLMCFVFMRQNSSITCYVAWIVCSAFIPGLFTNEPLITRFWPPLRLQGCRYYYLITSWAWKKPRESYVVIDHLNFFFI